MSTIKLYTYLKNPDLHAISAQEAISTLLGYTYIKGLRRYGCWELSFDDTSDNANTQLKTILESTYYIVNPNKEAYIESTLPTPNNFKQELVKVSPKDKVDYSNIAKTINKKCKTKLIQLEFYTVWEILCDQNSTIDTSQILSEICLTTSVKEGILANPISENCSLIRQ